MYASTVALRDGTLVTAFGYTRPPHQSGSMGVLRWRLPPPAVAAAEGFFAPTAVTAPTMAPPPRGQARWPKRSKVSAVPEGMAAVGYAGCTVDGVCDWADYAPLLAPWPADLAAAPLAMGHRVIKCPPQSIRDTKHL
jgi:hypothetical protein